MTLIVVELYTGLSSLLWTHTVHSPTIRVTNGAWVEEDYHEGAAFSQEDM